MASVTHELWRVDDIEIPVKIYWERRRDNRVSIAKNAVHLRLPTFNKRLPLGPTKKWATDWILQQFRKDTNLKERFLIKKYESGQIIKTHFNSYELTLTRARRETSKAKWENDRILIELNQELDQRDESKTIHTLIARVIGGHEQPRVAARIQEINEYCFGNMEIKGVRIKNNSSNWGSCSAKGNINISTKTLFAPARVQDYIFVHELAHRVELNHSPAYWKIVDQIMPDYKKCEQWLKENVELCEF